MTWADLLGCQSLAFSPLFSLTFTGCPLEWLTSWRGNPSGAPWADYYLLLNGPVFTYYDGPVPQWDYFLPLKEPVFTYSD